MSKKMCLVIGLVMVFMSIVGSASAETLLGKNYVGGSFGVFQFGDDELDEAMGNGYGLDVIGNINVTPHIDLQLAVGYVWSDGEAFGIEVDATSIGGSAEYVFFLNPNEKMNPYIGAGIVVVKTEIDISDSSRSTSADETDTGFGGKVGVELEFTEQVLFNFGLGYIYFEDEDSVDLNAGVGYWFNDRIMGALNGSYDFESEDSLASVGLIFKL